MRNYRFPDGLEKIVSYFRKFPGVGSKTAERFAFDLLNWKEQDLASLGSHIKHFHEKIKPCTICGCLLENDKCPFCQNSSRDRFSLCILSSPRDVYLFEQTNMFKGLYHIIRHLINPLEGKGTEGLFIEGIKARIEKEHIQEVIIALDSTLEGDATSLFLKKELKKEGISISRLAFGMPVGSSIEHIDEGTLSKAFTGRQLL